VLSLDVIVLLQVQAPGHQALAQVVQEGGIYAGFGPAGELLLARLPHQVSVAFSLNQNVAPI